MVVVADPLGSSKHWDCSGSQPAINVAPALTLTWPLTVRSAPEKAATSVESGRRIRCPEISVVPLTAADAVDRDVAVAPRQEAPRVECAGARLWAGRGRGTCGREDQRRQQSHADKA